MSGVNTEIGDFRYYLYKELRLDAWSDHFSSLDEGEDGSGHVLVLFTDVIRQLSKGKACDVLSVSSPFYVGVQYVDDDLGMVIMDILH
jgi:hypothetical protein